MSNQKANQFLSDEKETEKYNYAQIPYHSVVLAAETNGITELREDIAKLLTEDVSYRLREIIHKCSVHMRQNKRKKLTTADVNEVFQTSDVPPIYGHVRTEEHLNLVYVKNAGVFVPEEVEVQLANLALSDTVLFQKGEPFVKGAWINPDVPTETNGNTEDTKPAYQVPPHLVNYYTCISRVIMCGSENLFQVVLKDLQGNSKIGPIVTFLINLMSLGLSKLSSGGGPGAFLRHRLLCTIEALTHNSNIKSSANIFVDQLIPVVLNCILDPALIEGLSPKCNYQLTDLAAQVLAKIMTRWCCLESKLKLEILQKLESTLLNENRSLHSHYAALRTLCALGHEAVNYSLWPHVEQYFLFLDTLYLQNNITISELPFSTLLRFQQISELIEIEGALLDAAELMYREVWQNQSSLPENIVNLDRVLELHFGDSLCARRPYYPVATIKHEEVSISGSEGKVLASSVTKNTSSNNLHYRNQTAIEKTPIYPSTLFLNNNRNIPGSFPYKVINVQSNTKISSVFELPNKHEHHSSTNCFSFASDNMSRRLKQRQLDPTHKQLVCPSVYFSKSCQINCIGKSAHKQHKNVLQRSSSFDVMTCI